MDTESTVNEKPITKQIDDLLKNNRDTVERHLNGVIKRAESGDWTVIDKTVRGHPVRSFISNVEFLNTISLLPEDRKFLAKKTILVAEKLVELKLLEQAEVGQTLKSHQ